MKLMRIRQYSTLAATSEPCYSPNARRDDKSKNNDGIASQGKSSLFQAALASFVAVIVAWVVDPVRTAFAYGGEGLAIAKMAVTIGGVRALEVVVPIIFDLLVFGAEYLVFITAAMTIDYIIFLAVLAMCNMVLCCVIALTAAIVDNAVILFILFAGRYLLGMRLTFLLIPLLLCHVPMVSAMQGSAFGMGPNRHTIGLAAVAAAAPTAAAAAAAAALISAARVAVRGVTADSDDSDGEGIGENIDSDEEDASARTVEAPTDKYVASLNVLDDDSVLDDLVKKIRSCTVSDASRYMYHTHMINFIVHLYVMEPNLLTDSFIIAVGLETVTIANGADRPNIGRRKLAKIKKAAAKSVKGGEVAAIKLADLTAHQFMKWVLSRRKAGGAYNAPTTYNAYRAGLYNYFRDCKVKMSETLEDELKSHYKGLKIELGAAIGRGGGKCTVGKEALDFELYKWLGMKLMCSKNVKYAFVHLFLLCCWGLMCRAGNVVGVNLAHMKWHNDALGVQFAQQKNDKGGENRSHVRHLYANPINPEICVITGLAIWWSVHPAATNQIKLFSGGHSYSRYKKSLDAFFAKEWVLNYLWDMFGITPEMLGTHSNRKGAATYCASGSTACPSITAIILRAGWAMGGVSGTYLKFQDAGDQHVGRTLAGLACDSPDFAILPPFFKPETEEEVELIRKHVRTCFPTMHNHHAAMGEILQFCLASLVYHHKTGWLKKNLGDGHYLFDTVLFSAAGMLEELMPLVHCHSNAKPGDPITATGIPPYVRIISKVDALERQISLLIAKVDTLEKSLSTTLPQSLKVLIQDMLNEYAKSTGEVTPTALSSLMQEINTQIKDLGHRIDGKATSQQDSESVQAAGSTESNTTTAGSLGLHKWLSGNSTCKNCNSSVQKFAQRANPTDRDEITWSCLGHHLPESFKFPKYPLQAWQWFCAGHSEYQYPALHQVRKIDMPTRNLGTLYSDYRFLMDFFTPSVKSMPLGTQICPTQRLARCGV